MALTWQLPFVPFVIIHLDWSSRSPIVVLNLNPYAYNKSLNDD